MEELDREAFFLARGGAGLRLRIGETLELLKSSAGHHALGFSSMAMYAQERCERSGHWAADNQTLARQLGELPTIRTALMTGKLGWSMAEVLARYAVKDTEKDLVTEARHKSVREMREVVIAISLARECGVSVMTVRRRLSGSVSK